jgi:hypothetical protein
MTTRLVLEIVVGFCTTFAFTVCGLALGDLINKTFRRD